MIANSKEMYRKFSFMITALTFCIAVVFQTINANASELPLAVSPEISYEVSMPKPSTHLLEVSMRVKWQAAPGTVELKMPVWTPGSYLIREFARHLQDFAVTDSNGTSLGWEKVNKNTWQVKGSAAKEIVVNYRVYANDLTVRTNELNSEHAFWNNAALLLYPANQLNMPSTLTVIPFGNWKIATGLPPVSGKPNTFRAPNFDILYDSPFEVGNFKEATFVVGGVPHRIVICGDGNYDLKQMAVDAGKIVEQGAKIFGSLPMENYLFIINLRGGGGLEHLNSTALQFNRFGFKPRLPYIQFLSLVAHEYFHLWNVKRIRPDALGPFDYEKENYTKLLWVAEGVTSYYEGLLLLRAGLVSDDEYLNSKEGQIRDLQNRPGRFQTSLEEASMDAWIKYYRPDENSVNNQISYYDKGEIVGMLLDFEIRSRSQGKRSLDDVMRDLFENFYKRGKNFAPADFQSATEKAAGGSLEEFFTSYVSGRVELDYNKTMNSFGLHLRRTEPNKGRAYIGAETADENGRLIVKIVRAGTPAFEQGLNTSDQIVAIDGNRANQTFLQSYLRDRLPGDAIKLTIFRFDKLQDMNFVLGDNTVPDFAFERVPNPTPMQRQLYREYFGTE